MMMTVGLVAYPGVSLFHFSVPWLLFRETMQPAGLARLLVVADQPQPESAAMQIQVDGDLSLLAQTDVVIVPGWPSLDTRPSDVLTEALRMSAARDAWVVGLCYGAYALAYSGLLDGRTAATHWLAEQDFSQRFPQIRLETNALYVEDGRMITSAGSAASLDCCLHLIRKLQGASVANRMARIMVIPPHREGGQAQYIDRPMPVTVKDARMRELLDDLRQNLQHACSIDELADRMAMSRRTFTRQFTKATGMTLGQWLNNERLQQCLPLLESSQLSIDTVAEQAGFQSTASFRQHFQRRYRISPTAWRKLFNQKAIP